MKRAMDGGWALLTLPHHVCTELFVFFGNPPCLRVECALALFHLFPRHTTLSFKVDKLDVEKCIQACILFYYLKSPCFYFVLRKRFWLECRIPDRSTYVRFKFLLTRNAGHRYLLYASVFALISRTPIFRRDIENFEIDWTLFSPI